MEQAEATREAREAGAPSTGLVLPGGGARGAYQVGVLRGVAEIWRKTGLAGYPFPAISGSSAGTLMTEALPWLMTVSQSLSP